MSTPTEEASEQHEHWIDVVREKVAAIRFGSIQITVHEGRVTLVEAIEKTRITSDKPEKPLPTEKSRRKP
jgi:hypothetical protein